MQIHSAEEAKRRFDTLPPEIKEILYSPEMAFAVQQVGQKNHLHIDQIDFLNTETGQVLLGFVDVKDFTTELAENLNINNLMAETIAKDIDEMLFVKIRDAMKKVYEEGKKLAPITSSPTPVVSLSKLPPLEPRPTSSQPTPAITPAPTAPSAPVSAPATTPVVPQPLVPAKPTIPLAPTMAQAQTMLSQKTVEIAPQAAGQAKSPANPASNTTPQPPMPGNYKKDPYREPAE